jgi:hypothetical protein
MKEIFLINFRNEKELWNFIRDKIQTIDGVQNLNVNSSLKIFKWNTCYFFWLIGVKIGISFSYFSYFFPPHNDYSINFSILIDFKSYD